MRSFLFAFLALLGRGWAANPDEAKQAGIDDQAKAAYFVLASSGYVFALNVAANGDVYYHMNAPSSHSWMGVGFGSSMDNARMLISYVGSDGHTLVNTCRMSKGHSEPEWESDVVIEGVHNDTYAPYSNTLSPDGIMIAHAICRNCSQWATGGLDTSSTAQPFIFALGPNVTLEDDHPNAPLRLHEFHGKFQLDMTVATNFSGSHGRVPAPQDPGLQVGDSFWAFANYMSSNVYKTGTDSEWAQTAHAVFMCLAFLLVFPLGAICLRLVRRAMVHAIVQVFGLGLVLIGFGLGIYASKLYNKSKSFASAHQIIGLLVFAALFLQVGLGLSHHLLYMRTGSPTILGKIHRFLGISILVLGIVNGGLGLDFAGSPKVAYGVVVAIMVVIFAVLSAWVHTYVQRHVYKPEKEPFAKHDYGSEPPAEYEMSFATMGQTGYVQTPRTPFFGQAKYTDDPEDYRSYATRENEQRGRQESLYTDTPASDRENPFKSKWEAVPLR
ncbi:uncharacterized protein MYCFIDRAFT_86102 [Pseudocercospora fijiensis CIRAD86]|uniref:Cytochrome b561 domain-containing protein n=1 Tax=Pseudocercospora fijiensis (strain CIRAD86) TaxID=383855 RepID=N1Q9B3_PSEFD|nr:uncharacterized protein MYCFIDRAFT_86102 [Pseudocercospora fijiensis CIRAD86]EME88381.1 hypothetical protein MYCFIDRAFT_86102 [Pseudocercospora fijiensis CIRAD86]